MLGRIMSGWSDAQLVSVAVAPRDRWTWSHFLDRDPDTGVERGCLVAHAVDHDGIPRRGWRLWRPRKGRVLHQRVTALPDSHRAWRRFDALVRWHALRRLRAARSPDGWEPGHACTEAQRSVDRKSLDSLVPVIQRRAWKILALRSGLTGVAEDLYPARTGSSSQMTGGRG